MSLESRLKMKIRKDCFKKNRIDKIYIYSLNQVDFSLKVLLEANLLSSGWIWVMNYEYINLGLIGITLSLSRYIIYIKMKINLMFFKLSWVPAYWKYIFSPLVLLSVDIQTHSHLLPYSSSCSLRNSKLKSAFFSFGKKKKK